MSATAETELPPLWRDRSFLGITITQYLGAFNDNLFKQLILLYCLDLQLQGGKDQQLLAQALFAIPFVLFSGLAGFLADKQCKRTIIVRSKVAEIVVMSLGLITFVIGSIAPGMMLPCC
ncbi:MAG: hypothetical protein R3C11_21185 [Planctomycetaceae bacterium]